MRINRGFLAEFVDRFKADVKDDWLRDQMRVTQVPKIGDGEDPAMLLRVIQCNLDEIYVPSKESIRIGKWVYSIARGFISHRYQSPQEYVDICMSRTGGKDGTGFRKKTNFSADSIPIYAVDGLPGAGKSALFRAIKRIFPPPSVLSAEGNPPQQIGTLSALWVSVTINFNLKNWIKDTLNELGIGPASYKGINTIEGLSPLLYKTFYRLGVAAIFVDELQFASGRTSALRVLGHLLAMRDFGVPIIFFANTDLLKNMEDAPAQITQRIPHDKKTFSPLLRGDPEFTQILTAQLDLVPFGYTIDLEKDDKNIYDMVAGLPRASAKLIELGCVSSIAERRQLTIQDLVEARRSDGFSALRRHISLLTSIAPVDADRYPELSSNNAQFDHAAAYQKQLAEQRVADAAALALYGQLSEAEREGYLAAETKILRDAGKIPSNVQALGEAKRKRKPSTRPDEMLQNSYAAKRLAKFPSKNPTGHGSGHS